MILPEDPGSKNEKNEEYERLAVLLERSIHDLNNAAIIFDIHNQMKISRLVFEAIDLLMQARSELGKFL